MLKINNKLLILITLVFIVAVGAFIVSFNHKDQTIRVVGQLQEIFESVDDLKQRASAIVEVQIIDNQTIVYKDLPFTISRATVLSKFKGKVNEGEEIKLIETGGKYKLTGDNPKEVKGQEVEWAFEGVQVMQPGEHLILFVNEFVGPQVKGAYVPLGVYQGKFKVEQDGKVTHQAPKGHKFKDYTKPLTRDRFTEKLM